MKSRVSFGSRVAFGAVALSISMIGGGAILSQPVSAAPPTTMTTIASGLNAPRHLTVGPDGALYVALAGSGGPSSGTGSQCVATDNEAGIPTQDCIGSSGTIDRVSLNGAVSTVLAGLPSVVTEPTTTPPIPAEFNGPSDVVYAEGKLHVLLQGVDLNPDGSNTLGSAGADLGQMVTAAPGSSQTSWSVGPNFAVYAAQHPQGSSSVGTGPGESPTDSDPYALTPYKGGWAVADAAANALLWVSPSGAISPLASFSSLDGGAAQAVPTSVAVGPDGALYVGLLAGTAPAGSAAVYRVAANQAPRIVASGFSTITDIKFDRAGQMLVLEYDTNGLLDHTGASGAVIRVNADGTKSMLAGSGLFQPTGMAVGPDGSIYVSNKGDTAGQGSIVRIPVTSQDGYQELASDGGAFDFGTYQFMGSLGGLKLDQPIVSGTSTLTAAGYWDVASDGGVFSFGAASFYGSLGGVKLNAPIVGIGATPDGLGYWLVGSDGGIFTFGDAQYFGSMGGHHLNSPIVGMQATPDGGGYWEVASDGGIFSFGDAKYFGSMGGHHLNSPIVGIGATPDGGGYWEVASDGGIFTFGDAQYFGSMGGHRLNSPIVGMQAAPDGAGYLEVASDGGIFSFGDAQFFGSTGGLALDRPVIGLS